MPLSREDNKGLFVKARDFFAEKSGEELDGNALSSPSALRALGDRDPDFAELFAPDKAFKLSTRVNFLVPGRVLVQS